VAVPVGPPDLAERLSPVVDQVVVLLTPDPYLNVGQAYERFPQVDDDEVLRCLSRESAPRPHARLDASRLQRWRA
jgi:predicted phosphoribosyltransferase